MKIIILKNRKKIIELCREVLEFEFIDQENGAIEFERALEHYGVLDKVDSCLSRSQGFGITINQIADIISVFYIDILLKERSSDNYKKYFLKFLDMIKKELRRQKYGDKE